MPSYIKITVEKKYSTNYGWINKTLNMITHNTMEHWDSRKDEKSENQHQSHW